jgi:hypothetical protein
MTFQLSRDIATPFDPQDCTIFPDINWNEKSEVLDFINSKHICEDDLDQFKAMLDIILSSLISDADQEDAQQESLTQFYCVRTIFCNICGEIIQALQFHQIDVEALSADQMLNCIGFVLNNISSIGIQVDDEVVPLEQLIAGQDFETRLVTEFGIEGSQRLLSMINPVHTNVE